MSFCDRDRPMDATGACSESIGSTDTSRLPVLRGAYQC
jgi:hypothetical protein